MDAHAEIARAIDNYRDKVVALSHEIHEHPELKFQEHFAAGLLTKAAAELGLEVEREVGGLKTAFRAEFGARGPAVAILAEYDALPNGHSCGHNLIAGAALSAAPAIRLCPHECPLGRASYSARIATVGPLPPNSARNAVLSPPTSRSTSSPNSEAAFVRMPAAKTSWNLSSGCS